jgi:hypothetical protein
MINYSQLPQRVRRIAKQYEYCISMVGVQEKNITFMLKDGYQTKEGKTTINMDEDSIYSFKSVVRPSSRSILVALFGFTCPICGKYIAKGNNYADLSGMRLCMPCSIDN